MRSIEQTKVQFLFPFGDGHADRCLRSSQPLSCAVKLPVSATAKSGNIAIEISHVTTP